MNKEVGDPYNYLFYGKRQISRVSALGWPEVMCARIRAIMV